MPNKCDRCQPPVCCSYYTQELDTPRSKADFDHLLWQIAHQDTQIYKDEDGWYLLVHRPCTHLDGQGRCGIYAERPQICRDYSNDFCEYDEPAERHFELFFADYASLLRYCQRRFKTWGQARTAD